MKLLLIISIFSLCVLLSACGSTKEVNIVVDDQLRESYQLEEGYEHSFESYREGASGGVNSKSSGGCGCQ